MPKNLTFLVIISVITLLSREIHAKNFCDFNGESQVVGATLGPYICSEKGIWLDKKDACMYNGKPYAKGATIAAYVCKPGKVHGSWVDGNAYSVQVPVGVNNSQLEKDKSKLDIDSKTVSPTSTATQK